MIEIIMQGIILAALIISAYIIIRFRDLLSAAIAFGIFSFLLSLEFFILQAPDVAIAEAGIGAGLTTAIYILAVRGTQRFEEAEE
jgi:energy-converting hydrogenase B subunit D